MKKLIAFLTALVCALSAVPALADAALDPVSMARASMEDWGIWLALGVLVIALAVLIVIIIRRRRGK